MKRLLVIFLFLSFQSFSMVVVNKKNPVNSITLSSLQNIYLMNINLWLNNKKIQLVDYKTSKQIRKTFSKHFLNLSPYRVSKYWIRASLGGRGLPPIIIENTSELVDLIKNNIDAIGYVDDQFKLPPFLKRLTIAKE